LETTLPNLAHKAIGKTKPLFAIRGAKSGFFGAETLMRYTDIAIIGGGLAGSSAAAMLGRAGIPSLLIDPHQVYPFDFRVEKLAAQASQHRVLIRGHSRRIGIVNHDCLHRRIVQLLQRFFDRLAECA